MQNISHAVNVSGLTSGCRYNPIKTIKTSFIGTMNMLGLAKRTHARFLLTSTSEVPLPVLQKCTSCFSQPMAPSGHPSHPPAQRISGNHEITCMPQGMHTVDSLAHLTQDLSFKHSSMPCICIFANRMPAGRMLLHRRAELVSRVAQVYGDPLEHPQTETYWGNVNPIGERSCYDEGKRAAECLTFDYQREHNLEVRSCRHMAICIA